MSICTTPLIIHDFYDELKLIYSTLGKKGIEPLKQMSSHFECDAFTNFAIYPSFQIKRIDFYRSLFFFITIIYYIPIQELTL